MISSDKIVLVHGFLTERERSNTRKVMMIDVIRSLKYYLIGGLSVASKNVLLIN